jgi:hypothetical protein
MTITHVLLDQETTTGLTGKEALDLLASAWTLFGGKMTQPQSKSDLFSCTCRGENLPVLLGDVIAYAYDIDPNNQSDENLDVRFVVTKVNYAWQLVVDLYFYKAKGTADEAAVEPWRRQGKFILSDKTDCVISMVDRVTYPAVMRWLLDQIAKF